jgi:sugar lactone lactonase YvrE
MTRSTAATVAIGKNASGQLSEQEAAASVKVETPQLTEKEFLIISSPKLKKIVYTALKNFQSTFGRTYALIDTGIEEPCGLALDPLRGHLYVADRGVRKIFRYSIYAKTATDRLGETTYSLHTDQTRLTILSGRVVEWVAVDRKGDVFYSATDTNNINKITSAVMDNLADGVFSADSLTFVSEKEREAEEAANAEKAMESEQEETVTDAPAPSQEVFSVYEADINPRVTKPAGVATDGLRLFWANAMNGKTSGSVVRGEVDPKPPPRIDGDAPAPYPATSLSNASDAAQGVARAEGFVFFSTPGSAGGKVMGVPQDGGTEVAFVSGLGEPRGLAWDHDNTMFVADEAAGKVYSFPSGRMVEGAPLSKAVDIQGAFGVAVFTEMDEAFSLSSSTHQWQSSATHGGLHFLVVGMLLTALFAVAI